MPSSTLPCISSAWTTAWMPHTSSRLRATAANPTTILSWVAVFTALPDDTRPVPLVLGVGVGSLAWFVLLTAGVAAVRHALSRRAIQVADVLAGLGLIGFGAALAWSALR